MKMNAMKNTQRPVAPTPKLILVTSLVYISLIVFLTLLTPAPKVQAAVSADSVKSFSSVSHAQRCATAAQLAARIGFVEADAIKHCNMAIRTEPLREDDLAVTYINRGVIYKKLNRYDKALHDYYSARTLNRDIAAIYVNIGNVFYGERNFENALRYYDKALALDVELKDSVKVAVYTNRGMTYHKLDYVENAVSDLQNAVEISDSARQAAKLLNRLTAGGTDQSAGLNQQFLLDSLAGL